MVQPGAVFCPSVQYLSFFWKALPRRSWILVAVPCFTVGKSFTSWYALLLLFVLILSSVSPHCSLIRFSFAFFRHLLMLLFIPLCFRHFRFESVLFQFSPFIARIKNICSDPGFLLLTVLAKVITGCFSHCCLKVVIIELKTASSLFMMVRGANFPPIIGWKVSNKLRSFSLSRSNLSHVCFDSLILFRRRWKSSSASCGHLLCLLMGNFES